MIVRILVVLLCALAIPAPAANFSGKWLLEFEDDRGRTRQRELTLNQVGSEVTGAFASAGSRASGHPTGGEIYGAKVAGDAISFYSWEGHDRPAKIMYEGTMSGDGIEFTVTGSTVRFNIRGEPLDRAGPQKWTAKRTK